MKLNEEQRSLLWLSSAEIAASRVKKLIAHYGSAAAVWYSFRSSVAPVFQSGSLKVLEQLHSDSAMEALYQRLQESHVHLLFQMDEDYPEWLSSIDDAPYLLYYAGRLSSLKMPMVGMVGTRKASQYGLQMAHSIARGLAEAGVTVVSGLARGIDGAAHRGALDGDGSTIGVLGCGINAPYPPEHTPLLREIAKGKGLILSEYPLDAEPAPFHFPYRNRIISGLSRGVIFVEGAVKSGGMLTVNLAADQGREVFAVPGRVGTQGTEGPHTILREGARVVTCAQDVLDDLGLAAKNAPQHGTASLQPDEQRIVDALHVQPLTVDALSQQLSMDAGQLMTELCMMEIKGLVVREAGNYFSTPVAAQK